MSEPGKVRPPDVKKEQNQSMQWGLNSDEWEFLVQREAPGVGGRPGPLITASANLLKAAAKTGDKEQRDPLLPPGYGSHFARCEVTSESPQGPTHSKLLVLIPLPCHEAPRLVNSRFDVTGSRRGVAASQTSLDRRRRSL